MLRTPNFGRKSLERDQGSAGADGAPSRHGDPELAAREHRGAGQAPRRAVLSGAQTIGERDHASRIERPRASAATPPIARRCSTISLPRYQARADHHHAAQGQGSAPGRREADHARQARRPACPPSGDAELQDAKLTEKLLTTLAERYARRPGGYTRVVKAGFRYGDDAAMAIIELVDRDIDAKGQDSGPVAPRKRKRPPSLSAIQAKAGTASFRVPCVPTNGFNRLRRHANAGGYTVGFAVNPRLPSSSASLSTTSVTRAPHGALAAGRDHRRDRLVGADHQRLDAAVAAVAHPAAQAEASPLSHRPGAVADALDPAGDAQPHGCASALIRIRGSTWSTARLSPGLARMLGDAAVALGAQHVLHLHRLDDRQRLAGLDLLALVDGERRRAGPASATAASARCRPACFTGISGEQLGGARRQHLGAAHHAAMRQAGSRARQPLDLHGRRRGPRCAGCSSGWPGRQSVAREPALAVDLDAVGAGLRPTATGCGAGRRAAPSLAPAAASRRAGRRSRLALAQPALASAAASSDHAGRRSVEFGRRREPVGKFLGDEIGRQPRRRRKRGLRGERREEGDVVLHAGDIEAVERLARAGRSPWRGRRREAISLAIIGS